MKSKPVIIENLSGWRDWQSNMSRHKKHVKQILSSSSRIDNTKPKGFPKHSQMASLREFYTNERKNEIQKSNEKFLERLLDVTSAVQSSQLLEEKNINKYKERCKKEVEKQREKDNMQIYKRIIHTSSSLNFSQFEKDFNKSKEYSKLRTRKNFRKLPKLRRSCGSNSSKELVSN
ncbi:unnamed protein product [Blepharisma stoltei]|uniref:Uncharacterized protein n=1 Tax=Blepharisma stoltei TaxID=1481888 RepID=A0AAU9J6D3_9CILI|nr:unnamed protein product [Blepharisma stoltei]